MIKIRKGLWAFPSFKNSTQITSWWLDTKPQPVLIDCPELNASLISHLKELAGERSPKIILTSRDAHANFKKLRETLAWDALVQEQEAYLLYGMKNLETFSKEYLTESGLKVLWTPGPTPGSCIAYAPPPWNVLFCGRLLIPVASNQLAALRTKKTFHWSMQKKSLKKMRTWIPLNSFPSLASGGIMTDTKEEKLLPWEAWLRHD